MNENGKSLPNRDVTDREADQLPKAARRRKRSHEVFKQRVDAWIALHPVLDHEIDDSREAIYEG